MQRLDEELAFTVFHQSRFLRNAICVLSCFLIQPWCLTASADATDGGALSSKSTQTADILGIRREVERIISLRRGASSDSEKNQLNNNRAFVLRRIFDAILQLQAAESQLEFEINYTYDAIEREQRKENKVNQLFNIANFTQSSVLGIIAPVCDLREQFIEESTVSLVSGAVGTLLPILGIFYTKFAKAHSLTPPALMSNYLNGKAVDGSGLPPLVVRYLNSPAPGESRTRRDVLNEDWKKRFKADLDKKDTLHGIDDGKARSQGYLHDRLVLLWSLYTTIEGFDSFLLSLLIEERGFQNVEHPLSKTVIGSSAADDAARLLHIEALVAELKSLDASGEESERKRDLQITLLETLLSGSLEMAVASDRCQKELNYQYDVVLAELTNRQASIMQKLYEANFIQGGTFGMVASYLFLKKRLIPAGKVLLVGGGVGFILTGISYMALYGGWRKNQTGPNSLADFFELRPEHGLSPLVYAYLNSASPSRTDGKTRRQNLEDYWNNNSIVTMNLKNRRTLEKLGSMPSCKRDTIKLVLNRIALLSTLREQYAEFDVELLELLRKAWPVNLAKSSPEVNAGLNPAARATAALLGVGELLEQKSDENAKLLITRQVLDGFLSMTADANLIGQEVDHEFKILDRMERERDKIIQLTNNANFFQGSVIGLIATSLGLAATPADVVATNKLAIISSAMSGGLAGFALMEGRGGWRPEKANPNSLNAAFGKNFKFYPVTTRYLNSPEPDSQVNLSRREALLKYWKESHVLGVNIKKDSTVQKLSAEGKAHHWWSETIHLINNRITMLFDLRAVMRSSNVGFDELIKVLD